MRIIKHKKIITIFSFLSLLLFTGCDSENESNFQENFKNSLEEGEESALTIEGGIFLNFSNSGMTYYGVDANYDRYDTPFEHMQNYSDYNLEFDEEEETLTIIVEDGEYELDILGPRVFRDDINDIDLTANKDFFTE